MKNEEIYRGNYQYGKENKQIGQHEAILKEGEFVEYDQLLRKLGVEELLK